MAPLPRKGCRKSNSRCFPATAFRRFLGQPRLRHTPPLTTPAVTIWSHPRTEEVLSGNSSRPPPTTPMRMAAFVRIPV